MNTGCQKKLQTHFRKQKITKIHWAKQKKRNLFRHSREGGNLPWLIHSGWIPAFAGMTILYFFSYDYFLWARICLRASSRISWGIHREIKAAIRGMITISSSIPMTGKKSGIRSRKYNKYAPPSTPATILVLRGVRLSVYAKYSILISRTMEDMFLIFWKNFIRVL